jgi:hypothetical protein
MSRQVRSQSERITFWFEWIKWWIKPSVVSAEPDESALLIAFARAASKAQEIEALLQETLIGVEVANDTQNRPLAHIAREIEKLPLGVLKRKYLETIGNRIEDPLFHRMWKEINEERIFLMHKFFHVFPVTALMATRKQQRG